MIRTTAESLFDAKARLTQSRLSGLISALGLGFSLLLSSAALAQDGDDADREDAATADADGEEGSSKLADRIKAVERKVFLKKGRFELMPYVGMDLNDAFFQHFFVGAAASWHVEDSLALELRGGFAFAEIEKGSVRFTRVATGSLLEGAPSLLAHAELDAVAAPIYGKLSLFGESILHFDTFLALGGGIFVTQREQREGEEAVLTEVTNVNPAVNLGLGMRFFANEWLVFRVELRNYTYIETGDQSDLQNVTLLGLAVSGFFPTTFAYEYQ